MSTAETIAGYFFLAIMAIAFIVFCYALCKSYFLSRKAFYAGRARALEARHGEKEPSTYLAEQWEKGYRSAKKVMELTWTAEDDKELQNNPYLAENPSKQEQARDN